MWGLIRGSLDQRSLRTCSLAFFASSSVINPLFRRSLILSSRCSTVSLLRGAPLDVLDDAGYISPHSSCARSPTLLISALTVLVKSEHPAFLRFTLPYTDTFSLG